MLRGKYQAREGPGSRLGLLGNNEFPRLVVRLSGSVETSAFSLYADVLWYVYGYSIRYPPLYFYFHRSFLPGVVFCCSCCCCYCFSYFWGESPDQLSAIGRSSLNKSNHKPIILLSYQENYSWVPIQPHTLAVWEIPRSRYTHVMGRRPMSAVVFACYFEGLRSGWELVIHSAQCGFDNQSAGVARRLFFLLRHLSKFPSFKNENPSCRFWDMALGIFAVAFEKRSLPPYTRVRWRGMVRCGRVTVPRSRNFSDCLAESLTGYWEEFYLC